MKGTSMARKVRTLLASLLALWASPRLARAAGETLQCFTLRGPCQSIDTVDVLLPAAGAPALVANFGLLIPDGAGRARFACEAAIGGLAVRARVAPGGDIFIPGDQGLLHYRPSCGGQLAAAMSPGARS
jgi:hypothetical protein